MKSLALVLFLTLTPSNVKSAEKEELSKCLQLFRDYKNLTNIAFSLTIYDAIFVEKELKRAKLPLEYTSFDELSKELASLTGTEGGQPFKKEVYYRNRIKRKEYMENKINPKWLPICLDISLKLRERLVDSLTNLTESYPEAIDEGSFQQLQKAGHEELGWLVSTIPISPLRLSADQEAMLGMAIRDQQS